MKKGILIIALLSLAACGGGSPTSSDMPPTNNTPAQIVPLIFMMEDHVFVQCRCDAVTLKIDGKRATVLKRGFAGLYAQFNTTIREGRHSYTVVTCHDHQWTEHFDVRWPGKTIHIKYH